jgi:hypothetical protein
MSELREQIESVIENEPVALFMKGTPQFVIPGKQQMRRPRLWPATTTSSRSRPS